MGAVDRQKLLDAATARPWSVEDDGHGFIISGGDFVTSYDGVEYAYEQELHANADLIVAAVNEYEAHLACESGLRALVGFLRPDNRYAVHAREALERLDRIREGQA